MAEDDRPRLHTLAASRLAAVVGGLRRDDRDRDRADRVERRLETLAPPTDMSSVSRERPRPRLGKASSSKSNSISVDFFCLRVDNELCREVDDSCVDFLDRRRGCCEAFPPEAVRGGGRGRPLLLTDSALLLVRRTGCLLVDDPAGRSRCLGEARLGDSSSKTGAMGSVSGSSFLDREDRRPDDEDECVDEPSKDDGFVVRCRCSDWLKRDDDEAAALRVEPEVVRPLWLLLLPPPCADELRAFW